jgi:hypothetical protein
MQIRCALVGMPGSGKSTIGRQLAHRAGVPFIDLDHRLEQTIGTTIRSFFEAEGEARFRDLESQALADVAGQAGGMVLSTGGGAVLRPENRETLRQFTGASNTTGPAPCCKAATPWTSCATCTPSAMACTAKPPTTSSKPAAPLCTRWST